MTAPNFPNPRDIIASLVPPSPELRIKEQIPSIDTVNGQQPLIKNSLDAMKNNLKNSCSTERTNANIETPPAGTKPPSKGDQGQGRNG
jgi:hypothetical protein